MVSEDPWADYARIQAGAQLNASISQSDADDVRLDRILDGIALGSAEETAGVERAVKSYARRERGRRRTRSLTGHAFMPLGAVCSVETLIWKQAWAGFRQAFSMQELCLLVHSETVTATTPMTGAERTRLSRMRSSATYRAIQAATFA